MDWLVKIVGDLWKWEGHKEWLYYTQMWPLAYLVLNFLPLLYPPTSQYFDITMETITKATFRHTFEQCECA